MQWASSTARRVSSPRCERADSLESICPLHAVSGERKSSCNCGGCERRSARVALFSDLVRAEEMELAEIWSLLSLLTWSSTGGEGLGKRGSGHKMTQRMS